MKYLNVMIILLVCLSITLLVGILINRDAAEEEAAKDIMPPTESISADAIQEMNAIELRYDADGPFILIDLAHNVIGYYDACTPITHTVYYPPYKGELNTGVYKAFLMDDFELALMDKYENIIYSWGIDSYPKLVRYFIEPCPALVYGK